MKYTNDLILYMANEMKFRIQLAEYKKSVYKDSDAGYIITIKFPYLDYITSGEEIFRFDFKEFIAIIQAGVVNLCTDRTCWKAIRLHGFEHNQPVRFTFPDYGPPNIILVLQVFISEDDIDTIYKQPLYLSY